MREERGNRNIGLKKERKRGRKSSIVIYKEKDKFWATVEEDSEGIFDCLCMFNE